MNDILFKVQEAISDYYNKYEREPNAVLINENDLNLLKLLSAPFRLDDKKIKEKATYECCGLKVIPIKYGEPKAVEVEE